MVPRPLWRPFVLAWAFALAPALHGAGDGRAKSTPPSKSPSLRTPVVQTANPVGRLDLSIPVVGRGAPPTPASSLDAAAAAGVRREAAPLLHQPAAQAQALPRAAVSPQATPREKKTLGFANTEVGKLAPSANALLDGARDGSLPLAEGVDAAAAGLKTAPSGLSRAPSAAVKTLRAGLGDKSKGYAVLAPGSIVPTADTDALLATIRAGASQKHSAFRGIELYKQGTGWNIEGQHARIFAKEIQASRPVVEKLAQALREALPEENLEIRDAEIRITYDEKPSGGRALHTDLGGAVTMTFALAGPGTDIYEPLENGAASHARAPPLAATFITSMEREAATGVPATVHGAPDTVVSERVLLLIHFHNPAVRDRLEKDKALIERVRRLGDARVARVNRGLERAAPRKSASTPPAAGAWLKRWLGLD